MDEVMMIMSANSIAELCSCDDVIVDETQLSDLTWLEATVFG
jgi:hypothetical protein